MRVKQFSFYLKKFIEDISEGKDILKEKKFKKELEFNGFKILVYTNYKLTFQYYEKVFLENYETYLIINNYKYKILKSYSSNKLFLTVSILEGEYYLFSDFAEYEQKIEAINLINKIKEFYDLKKELNKVNNHIEEIHKKIKKVKI